MIEKPPVELTASRYFLQWLAEERLSLAFTTYQTNRLFLVGLKPDGSLSTFERLLDRPMGLYAAPDRLYLSTRYQLWRFDDALPAGQQHDGYDRLYVPRVGYTTGDLDVHDVGLWSAPDAPDGQPTPLFVNTLYSCLATLSERYSFRPVWKPPFISKLAPEDRCHLNGMALVDGQPRYVTAVSRSDVASGWRERREAGGCLIDVQSNELVLTELSMPHSPRVHDGRVWLLNSGTGELGCADLDQGRFEPVAFCPGYLRGLAFYGQYAIVGLSKPRHDRTFSGLPLDGRLEEKDAEARCGLMVIDLQSGDAAHWLEISGVVSELYDVQVLPGVVRPMSLGFKSDEICRLLTIDGGSELQFTALTAVHDDSGPLDIMALRQAAAAAAAVPTPPPPQVQRIARPDRTSATVRTIDNRDYRFQLSVNMTVAAVVQGFAHLTAVDLGALAAQRPVHEPLVATVALHGDHYIGMALAEEHPASGTAEVLSLFVSPDHRGRRLGSELVRLLERALAERGCTSVRGVYPAHWEGREALERLLARLGWAVGADEAEPGAPLCTTNKDLPLTVSR